MEVLIIEDDPEWGNNLHRIVTMIGFSCIIATDYLQALQLLHTVDMAVITLDLTLKSGDYREIDWEGWQLAEQAQKREIPIIIVSAHARANQVSMAFRKYGVLLFFFDKLDFHNNIRTFENIITETVVKKKNMMHESEQRQSQFKINIEADRSVNKTNSIRPLPNLRRLIGEYFNSSELMNLAFDLGINLETIPGDNFLDRVREFILLMERQGRLQDLITACEENRPHVNWTVK